MKPKTTNNSPSIFIKKIRVTKKTGGLAFKLEESKSGLNVIRGENSSGRTTLLNLLEFGLGGNLSEIKFIPEIKQCERLVLQVELNGVDYTIERNFWGSGQLDVYQGGIDAPLHQPPTVFSAGREYSDFLLHELGIPRISFVDERSGKEKPITFNDLYDGIYLDQIKGFSEIHARLTETKRENVFKILTNIFIPDLYTVLLEEASLKIRRDTLRTDFGAVERFLGSVELPTPIEIESRINDLQQESVNVKTQIDFIRKQLRSSPDYSAPLREAVLALEAGIDEKQKDILYTQQTLHSYADLENQLYEDLDKISRIRSSSQQLSSFEFEQCPRCLQAITPDMKHREAEEMCSLCARPLVRNSDQISELTAYEKQTRDQLSELSDLQEQYKANIIEVAKDLEALQTQLVIKRRELDEATAQFVSPFIQNIESLGYSLAAINEEIKRYTDFRRWQERIQQMRDELNAVNDNLRKIQERKAELLTEEKARQGSLQLFESLFNQFLNNVYPDFVTAKINPNTFLPQINDYDYQSKSATEKNISILGYYYALLRYSLETKSNTPRFLVIDTLRQDDLDENTYREVLRKFKELETKYKKISFQVFLVVREAFDFLRDDEIYQILPGKHLLDLP